MVFAPSSTSTELTSRVKKIDVIAPNKMLSKVHDSHGKRLFAMVMRSMFTNIPDQLTDLVAGGQPKFGRIRIIHSLSIRLSSYA